MRFRPSRRFLILTSLALVTIVLFLLLLPELARRATVDQLRGRIAALVHIEDVDLNLFTGRGKVSNLAISRGEDGRPILQLPTLDFRVSRLAALRGELVFNFLQLKQPRLFIERTKSGHLNIFDMMQTQKDAQADVAGLTIRRLKIEDGEITFVDQTTATPTQFILNAIHLTTGTLSTLPTINVTPTSFDLRLQIGRGSVVMTGLAAPFARPVSIELSAQWKDLDPTAFAAYLPSGPRIDLSTSWFTGQARYALTYQDGRITTHTLTTNVDIGPARVGPIDSQEPVLTVEEVGARDIHLDFLANRGRVGELVLRQPHFRLHRDEQGIFNVAQLFPTDGAPQAEGIGIDLSIDVAHARFEAGTLELADRTTSPAVMNVFRDVQLTLQDLHFAPNAEPARLEGEARLEGAPVRVTGTLRARPFATRYKLTARNVPLETFQGYIAIIFGTGEYSREGFLGGELEIALATQKDGGLKYELTGTVEGRDVRLRLHDRQDPFLTAQQFTIDIARMDILPVLQAEIARIQVVSPKVRIERDRERNLNLRRLWTPSKQQVSTKPPEASPGTRHGKPSRIAIRRLDVAQGHIEFADATVTPAFTTAISDVTAEVRHPTDTADRASLKLSGTLGDGVPLELSGWFTPFKRPLQFELQGKLRDYDVSRLNPYAEEYIKYRIRRGRVTTEGSYNYDAGNLATETEITLQHMELGEQVGDEFEKRVGMPLKQALALLENAEGEVRLSLPISGNVDSPEFRVESVVWTAVANAMLKVLTAPLRLIGTILTLGGKIGEVRIDPIAFLPGTLDPDPDAKDRLAKLADFLRNKPKVELELRGHATPLETEALKARRLREQIEAVKDRTDAQALTQLFLAAGGQESPAVPVPAKAKEQYLLKRMGVTTEDLRKLAEDRARVIEQLLIREGIKEKRLFVITKDKEAVTDSPPGRVEFKLLD